MLQPSLAASLWTAAVKALGCSFKLAYKINLTKKDIIKSDIKDLEAAVKSLTFDVPGTCMQTKAGRFIQGKVDCLPFAKKIRVDKKFTRTHQSYIHVQVCGNLHGVKKYDHLVEEFCMVTNEIMDFESTLVVVPYPNGPDSHKARPFAYDPSTLVNTWKCKMYIDQNLYIADSKPTSIKLFVGHNSSAAVSNLLDLARQLDEKEASIRVCHIQTSKVVVAGYLQGSTKTLNKEHWTNFLNVLPRLKHLDVKVQIRNIKDQTWWWWSGCFQSLGQI